MSAPLHWTYVVFDPQSDLEQGDILKPTASLRDLFERVHPYFCDSKFLAFMVLTQSCDLVRRKGETGKAQYISLAVIRSMEEMLPTFLDSVCKKISSTVYLSDSKDEANKLLGRIFNQNEQSLGLFYLHPDAQVQIAVPSIALLRVSVSFRAEHYQTLQDARQGRLNAEFRNKLGWLTGNLFSRVGTPDWSETKERKARLKELISSFLSPQSAEAYNSPLWVKRSLVEAAKAKGVDFSNLEKSEIISTLEENAPPTPKDEVIDAVIAVIRKFALSITSEEIEKLKNRLGNDARLTSAMKRASTERG